MEKFVGGCIAGGRNDIHINVNGDFEPYAFIHHSVSSIYEKTLLEAYKSPLFIAYKAGQPFNDNMLRPCPMLENPECLQGWRSVLAHYPPIYGHRKTWKTFA